MTPQQMKDVLVSYKTRLTDLQIVASEDQDISVVYPYCEARFKAANAYALNMIERMLTWDLSENMDKANRWLGFIQGVLWTTGLYSIEEMRDHNRT